MATWEILLYCVAVLFAVVTLARIMRRRHDQLVHDFRKQLIHSKYQLMEKMQAEKAEPSLDDASPEFQTKLDKELQKELERQRELEKKINPNIEKAGKKPPGDKKAA